MNQGGWHYQLQGRNAVEDSEIRCLNILFPPLFRNELYRDSHIRMWNLLKGKCSYTAKLELEGEIVAFTPGGEEYVLVCGKQVKNVDINISPALPLV
jgi:hypothetical protein